MSDTLTVHLSGISGQIAVEVPEGSTVGDAAREAGITGDASFLSGGQRLGADAPVQDGQTVVTTPPAGKQG